MRCLIGFIVDLTLVMDTLFWLTRHHGAEMITVTVINRALKMYNARKMPVHADIRTWVDEQRFVDCLDADQALQKITHLIDSHRFKPEDRDRAEHSDSDEPWMDPGELASSWTAHVD